MTNLAAVKERIARACDAAKRDPSSVKLVAVSKTKPIEAIREAYDEGQRDFGENYAQELVQKADALASLDDIRWHFIGHLQSNKAKMVAPRTTLVHSVDSLSLAKELGKRATKTLFVLIEVNVAGEATKSGIALPDLDALIDAIRKTPNLSLDGLMTMPPPGDPETAKKAFDALRGLRDAHGLRELSMGMTDDLEIAIACGATIVRVGTAIFGARST